MIVEVTMLIKKNVIYNVLSYSYIDLSTGGVFQAVIKTRLR